MTQFEFGQNIIQTQPEVTVSPSLAEEVAHLMQDKHSLASNALDHFSDWDANKDGSLSIDELNSVTNSQLSVQERATASILAKNFESARNLNTESLPKDLDGLTDTGHDYMQKFFAGDKGDGITHNDLNVLSMLYTSDGLQTIVHTMQQQEKTEAAISGAMVAISTEGTLTSLRQFILNPASRVFTALVAIANLAAAALNARNALSRINSDDDKKLEEYFGSKIDSANHWDQPDQ